MSLPIFNKPPNIPIVRDDPVSDSVWRRWFEQGYVRTTTLAAGTVTSIDVSSVVSGLSFSGGPVSTAGTILLAGILNVSSGGTGVSTITGYVLGNGTSPFTATSTIHTSSLTGILPVSSGGSGVSTITGYVLGNGVSPFSATSAIHVSSLTGVLPIANGGTNASTTPLGAQNLGVSSMGFQSSSGVAIVGGTINGTGIGATTASTGVFTTVSTTGVGAFGDNVSVSKNFNGITQFIATNTTAAASAQTQFTLTDGTFTTGMNRYNSSHAAFGVLNALDGFVYNNKGTFWIANNLANGVIGFASDAGTSLKEVGRFSTNYYFKASPTGTYIGETGKWHELIKTDDDAENVLYIRHSGATATNQYGAVITLTGDPNDTTRWFWRCVGNATARAVCLSNGDLQNTNNSYGAISDVKLKENIERSGSQREDIKALARLVSKYNLIGDKKRQIGLVAQEVEKISPGLVYESDDVETVDGKLTASGTKTKALAYSVLHVKALKALGEALEELDAIKSALKKQGILV